MISRLINRKRKPLRIIIVCTANVTRSPYFAQRLRNALDEKADIHRRPILVESAGVRAFAGSPPHPVIKIVAEMNGFTLAGHRSKPFTRAMMKKADLVLTMERWQAENLLEKFPELEGKVFSIREYGRKTPPEMTDIPDPTGLEVEQYSDFANIAGAEADRIAQHILQLEHR